ncbi:MYB-like transcription factor ETC3 isoform X2 [Malania oleifera]|nr:MYB-like transcription factor ETC3 isoform X2 [Malania oleifera]XP_057968250.1 MYB-like transcription factor ETC3 isoform X2 [Malania oleifera]
MTLNGDRYKLYISRMENQRWRKQPKRSKLIKDSRSSEAEEVSSVEWQFISMTEQEEDLISRMYKLVGDRWELIAGRIPGRKVEEIERFWMMKHGEVFAHKRKLHNIATNSCSKKASNSHCQTLIC